MTRRRSVRELARDVDDLAAAAGDGTMENYWIASLKAANDADLAPFEERLLEGPERYLSAAGWRTLQEASALLASRRAAREEAR